MTESARSRRGKQTRVWLAFSALAVLVILVFAPPFINVRRYRNRITEVVSASVGRPVKLSSVELRILPRPSFVLTDLVVEEDPAYGAEPVLHANTVTASIRLAPLWLRGRLEISRISVDEASLNLVRTPNGRWNLDAFFRTAATRSAGENSQAVPFPYLEATNSRVNIKNGVEKLPYSLVNADLSFWQESPGDWRVRMRGQPARTDVSLDLPDTGVVRLEARMHRAAELRQMPLHVDLDWREAQLGQLTRLVVGSDQGWRGDLAGELHLDGTPEAAQVRTRLRAAGVHRAEFAPASPIDFDASCGFIYHYSARAMENLVCDSPIGNGRARLTGEVPGRDKSPRLALELDRVPIQIALDVLRTVRNGLDPSLEAGGVMSGKISYAPAEAPSAAPLPPRSGARSARPRTPLPGPLSGQITVTSVRLSGDSLSKPIQVAKITVEPAADETPELAATVPLALGASSPLTVAAKASLTGYQLGLRGSASLERLRELVRMAGVSGGSVLDKVDGPPATLDMNAEGPWLSVPGPAPEAVAPRSLPIPVPNVVGGTSDHITGTLNLHGVSWKADFLANPVEISTATLRLDEKGASWGPVAFTYGLVRGTATVELAAVCEAAEQCPPRFTLQFGTIDTATLQAAILGARKPGTLLSSLLARLRPASAPSWPKAEGEVLADTLVLGPVTLKNASATLRTRPDGAEIISFEAALLGGRIHAAGNVTSGNSPDYKLQGRFEHLNAADMGRLLGMMWSGDPIDGEGQVEAMGFTDKDLGSSAKGSLKFDWSHGAVGDAGGRDTPPVLTRFDRWTADAEIAHGAITLKQNAVQRGKRKTSLEGSAVFGEPPKVTFAGSPAVRAAKR